MNKAKPEEIRFGACYTVSKLEFNKYPERVMAMAEEKLRHNLAHHVQYEKSIKTENEDFFELRLEVYVATPQKFWEIVNQEARKLATGF